jgi:hypothetical protein
MFRVKNPRDFGAALVFMIIGLAGLYFGADLTMGTAARMGPGYFPRLLSILIIAIGVFVGLKALVTEGPPIEAPKFRPMFFCLLSVIVFGYMIAYVGLAVTAVVMTLISAYARRSVNLLETAIFAVGMSLFTVLIFVYALGQPLPPWPWSN